MSKWIDVVLWVLVWGVLFAFFYFLMGIDLTPPTSH
jgi:hypothetical protein